MTNDEMKANRKSGVMRDLLRTTLSARLAANQEFTSERRKSSTAFDLYWKNEDAFHTLYARQREGVFFYSLAMFNESADDVTEKELYRLTDQSRRLFADYQSADSAAAKIADRIERDLRAELNIPAGTLRRDRQNSR